ncbi:MAG: helix-turn-helix domain-containing protein [Deltaproteobacteria bacterium]|nr:helix-turn-helix domain-containing protein [Deltaproteobacteria bacterium]
MSARRFGAEALGDPGFRVLASSGAVGAARDGGPRPGLHGPCALGPAFRREVEAFLEVTGAKASVLGEEAAGNRSLVGRLRRGASPCLRTVDRVRAWMTAHASAEETAAIRAGIDDGHNLVEAAGPGSSTAPPLSGGAVVNLEAEGGRGMYGNGSKHFSTREAAAWLGLSPRTLDRYRVSGDGPAFHRFGSRVLYLAADLEAWASTRRLSTSDDGPAGREGKP